MRAHKEFLIVLTLLLVMLLLSFFGEWGITGQLLAQENIQDLGLEVEGGGSYNWNLEHYQNNTRLTFVKATGFMSGNTTGHARAYLVKGNKKYLILFF